MKNIKNIRFKGYKAFSSEEYVNANKISNVNLIIGKNTLLVFNAKLCQNSNIVKSKLFIMLAIISYHPNKLYHE